MQTNEKQMKEPLFHITKRTDITRTVSWSIRLIAVLASLFVCGIVIVSITDYNPLEVYVKMFEGSFGSERKFFILLQNTAMLLCVSLAVTPAFKMKFWNLGGEGQVLVGGLASAACMFYAKDSLPSCLLILIMLFTSILSGIVWGVLPAIFKAIWRTNESLFTLMMNYVAIQLVSFFIMVWVPSGSSVMGIINQSTESGWLPPILGQKYGINIIVVALLTVIMFIYLRFSKQGYEISVVGESENTARYVGINVKKVIIRTMVISGAICGLTGFLLVSGTNHTISKELAGGMGFTAIMVSWLAKFEPGMMVFTSMFIVFLQKGAGEIATALRLNHSISDILTGIIIFFVIGSEFFINYKINVRVTNVKGKLTVMHIHKSKIWLSILLSVLTLGIYKIYWYYQLVKNIKSVRNDDSGCLGEMLKLLLIPYYSVFWWYTRAKSLKAAFAEQGFDKNDHSFPYLLLAIFGVSIVSMSIMQSDFNSLPSESESVNEQNAQKEVEAQ